MNSDLKGHGSAWRMADFMVYTNEGPRPETGMVSPPFAVHIDHNGHHVLSHLGTGLQCCVCARWTDAVAIAEELRQVGGWDFEEDGVEGPRVAAVSKAVKENKGLLAKMKTAKPGNR